MRRTTGEVAARSDAAVRTERRDVVNERASGPGRSSGLSVVRPQAEPPGDGPRPGSRLRFRTASRVAGAAGVVVGVLVLAGWVFDIRLLKSVSPHLATMKANTALGLTLVGAALWLLPADRGRRRLLVRGLAFVVAAIGLLTLAEYLF